MMKSWYDALKKMIEYLLECFLHYFKATIICEIILAEISCILALSKNEKYLLYIYVLLNLSCMHRCYWCENAPKHSMAFMVTVIMRKLSLRKTHAV